jgi:hypothetical protein
MPNRHTTLAGLFVLDVGLFALAGIPGLKNAHHGVKYVLGGIGWFGALVCTLVLVVLAVTTLVQNLRRRRTKFTATLLTLGAVCAAAALAAAAGASSAKPVIRLELPATKSTYVDLNRKGYSPGDYFLTSGKLLNLPAKNHAGRLGGVWTILSRSADNATFDLGLGNGTIFVAGRIVHSARTSTLAVTGGTGRYNGARGTVTFRYLSETSAELDVHLR